MPSLLEEFQQIALSDDGPARYIWSESKWSAADRVHSVESFLGATMDEVRLYHANLCVEEILRPFDMDDADFFRKGVLRREVTGNVSYPKQRDHSAHTLHNYLLGWYYVTHADAIRNALTSEFTRRGLINTKVSFEYCFTDLWPFPSLLHDIGYLFEGSLGLLSTAVQGSQVEIGAEVVDEYFSSYFWNSIGFGSIEDRQAALAFSGCILPDFSRRTMAAISDQLRYVGGLENIQSGFKKAGKDRGALPTEAFELCNRLVNRPSLFLIYRTGLHTRATC
jgi:hypothetical protein